MALRWTSVHCVASNSSQTRRFRSRWVEYRHLQTSSEWHHSLEPPFPSPLQISVPSTKIKDESARKFWPANFLSLKSSGGVVLSFTWLVKYCVRGVLIHCLLCLLIETILRKHHLLPSSQDSGRVLPGKEVKTSSAACHVMLLWLLIGNKLLFYFSQAQSKMQHLQRISYCRIQVCGSFKSIPICCTITNLNWCHLFAFFQVPVSKMLQLRSLPGRLAVTLLFISCRRVLSICRN